MSMPRILIIAGSDCSGGAGIQADIKTCTALGGYAMSAITAVTVQNTLGVSGVHPVPPAIVRGQIEACLSDIGADVIKIGMLLNAEIIEVVKDVLSSPHPNPLPEGEGVITTSPSGRGRKGEAISGEGFYHYDPPEHIARARTLRQNATDAEAFLWKLLRNRQILNLKFRRQHPIEGFVADFACPERRLIIELDGGQHFTKEGLKTDAKRTQTLESLGWALRRYSNLEILQQPESVLEDLYLLLSPSPEPSTPQESRKPRAADDGVRRIPIILDPVMVATSGDRLLDEAALQALIKLMGIASVITPNIPEAELLSGMPITSREDMLIAARQLQFMSGGAAIVLKGGHLEGETVSDLLYQEGETFWFESPRLQSRSTHGTGCTLASAIATLGAKGNALPFAVSEAVRYVQRAIETAPDFGGGHGPLNHLHPLVTGE